MEEKHPAQRRVYQTSDLEVFNLIQRPVWVCLCGEEWGNKKRLIWGNTACVALWNASSLQEIQDMDFNTDMSAAVKERYHDVARRCSAGETVSQLWTYYPGGTATTVTVTFSEIWMESDEDGQPQPAVLADVQHTREIQEQVNAEGLRSIEMLRHLPVAVSLFDVDGSLILQNPKDHALFGGMHTPSSGIVSTSPDPPDSDDNNISPVSVDEGTSKDENNHQNDCEFVRRFADPHLGRRILSDVVNHSQEYNTEVELANRAWFACHVQQSRDPVTGSLALLHSARDITEIIQAQKQAQALATKSELFACVAHEIRTPFHQVSGFNELMGGTDLTEEQREYVSQIDQASISMMSVLDDLLDFNKLEAGKLKIEQIPFDPGDVVTGSVAAVVPPAQKKNLRLSHHLDKNMPCKVLGDPNRLRQILLNFLNNAIKFTDQGKVSLHVTLPIDSDDMSNDGNRVVMEFSVRDTGIGVSTEHQNVIFKKYEQAGLSIARQFGGTGLGLAICHGLTQAMGGKIGVESEMGHGSKFWIRVPFQLPPEVAAMPRALNEQQSVGSLSVGGEGSYHILVAEDNKMNQKLVKSMLERIGHTVTLVDDGVQAVNAMASAFSFDLVLMDVQMPNMNGLKATMEIRRMGFSETDMPVVGLTADFRPSELETYMKSGMNSCLGKPVRMKVLQKCLQEIVSQCESQR